MFNCPFKCRGRAIVKNSFNLLHKVTNLTVISVYALTMLYKTYQVTILFRLRQTNLNEAPSVLSSESTTDCCNASCGS